MLRLALEEFKEEITGDRFPFMRRTRLERDNGGSLILCGGDAKERRRGERAANMAGRRDSESRELRGGWLRNEAAQSREEFATLIFRDEDVLTDDLRL